VHWWQIAICTELPYEISLSYCVHHSKFYRLGLRCWPVRETDTFTKIANASKVEMRFGNKEIKLKDEHLEGFRALTIRMIPN
jgi:hypothetical protein